MLHPTTVTGYGTSVMFRMARHPCATPESVSESKNRETVVFRRHLTERTITPTSRQRCRASEPIRDVESGHPASHQPLVIGQYKLLLLTDAGAGVEDVLSCPELPADTIEVIKRQMKRQPGSLLSGGSVGSMRFLVLGWLTR